MELARRRAAQPGSRLLSEFEDVNPHAASPVGKGGDAFTVSVNLPCEVCIGRKKEHPPSMESLSHGSAKSGVHPCDVFSQTFPVGRIGDDQSALGGRL